MWRGEGEPLAVHAGMLPLLLCNCCGCCRAAVPTHIHHAHAPTAPCRDDWGDAAELALRVAEAKEGIYLELTAGGIQAFEGVEELVMQVGGGRGRGGVGVVGQAGTMGGWGVDGLDRCHTVDFPFFI